MHECVCVCACDKLIYIIQFDHTKLIPRTKAVHESHCSKVDGPAKDRLAKTYGVNMRSIMNELQYFHTTSGMWGITPVIVMHLYLMLQDYLLMSCMMFLRG